ncbi:MAG: phosphoenolpyruvate kinase [Acidobacteriota bacterium]
MSKTIHTDGDEGVVMIVKDTKITAREQTVGRSPVHVVYGGAHLYKADTAAKLGKRAIASLDEYAPNFVEFAQAMTLPETASLPRMPNAVAKLHSQISKAPEKAREQNFAAWFAWSVHARTIQKLQTEPVEDFRIDFEDGYGFRPDDEEDGHAAASARELAEAFLKKTVTPFCGFRVKSFGTATRARAARTLDICLAELIKATGGRLPENFAVTLPKVLDKKQVKQLCKQLAHHEKQAGIGKDTIDVEILIETPEAIVDNKGRVPLRSFVKAAGKRRVSVHFGAYDYTSALSIAAPFQDIRHASCDFARNMMQASLASLGVRLSDSVTTELPVAVHRGDQLSEGQKSENRRAVHHGWRVHFENVTRSMSAGFYQSWDVHPNQLPARYAAVYAFFLYNCDAQARRLKGFIEKATQASMSGTTFDDAASAQGVLNFFRRAVECRALTYEEVRSATGLTSDDITLLSFADLVEKV